MSITEFNYESSGATHKGMRREYNEDCFLADPVLGVYVVADGMGGHQAGDVASRLAVDAIQKRLGETLRNVKNLPDSLGNAALDALNQANHAIRRNPLCDLERNQAKMGTTVAMVVTRGDSAIVAHVGDSRVYRLRRGKLQMLTRDHSFLQAQVGAGFVNNDEARLSHNRNLITRALGMEATVAADIGQSKVAAGDVFLICSDGLTTMVADEDIETIMEELKENLELACQVLVQVANDNGGHDNISVVVIRADPPGRPPAPTPGFWGRLFARLFRNRRGPCRNS